MPELKWRFPKSGGAERKGLVNSGQESFKRIPFKSFPREILQNSLDASYSDEEPVKVCFQTFEIPTANIPDKKGLLENFEKCKQFWSNENDYVDHYNSMINYLNSEKITCLRISDFNTTGLVGVDDDNPTSDKNQFLALTKSSGVSQKSSQNAGGNKGMGKNASFIMSAINTVFYSTVAFKDRCGELKPTLGYIGVTDQVSAAIDDYSDDYTQGKGFYSGNEKNQSVKGELLNLDPDFKRDPGDAGTDIYIIGFPATDYPNWERDVIQSILESFMMAIYRQKIEVEVNGRIINKVTIPDEIDNFESLEKSVEASLRSQYYLLSNLKNNVQTRTIDVCGEECGCLYALKYPKTDEQLATRKCAMIRWPYMQIKTIPIGTAYDVSALFEIPNNKTGQLLRNIENAEHNDWQEDRIKDKNERESMKLLKKSMRAEIIKAINEMFSTGDSEAIDPNGASDYLPDSPSENSTESSGSVSKGNDESPEAEFYGFKQNISFADNPVDDVDPGNGLEPAVSGIDETDAGEIIYPEGRNNGEGGEARPGDNSGKESPGDSDTYKRKNLAGVRYKVICLDKNNGVLRIIFKPGEDHENCFLALALVDDVNGKHPINILGLKANGKQVDISDGNAGPFSVKGGQKNVLEVITDVKGFYSCEVKILCD